MIIKVALLVSLFTLTQANVVTITADNWDEVTTGNKVFLKMYAPWCGHCKRLAPTWEDLAEKHTDSKVVIGEMDCTADNNKELCSSMGVSGYPTLLYSKGFEFEKYGSGRDIKELTNFVETELGETCLDNRELCSEEDQALLKGYESYTAEELKEKLEKAKQKKKEAQDTFTENVNGLNKQYEQFKTEKADAVRKASRTQAYAQHVLSTKVVETTEEETTGEETKSEEL